MSGFRTPQYNANGGETSGRADLSRHQYGDAADVWVENGAGRMADLNRDGRVDTRDAAILAEAADRVERAHPELAGGVGIYRANRAHGPFVHIDVRGSRARWGHAGPLACRSRRRRGRRHPRRRRKRPRSAAPRRGTPRPG